MSERDDAIIEIARKVLRVTTLETRGRDALDFHDLAVWNIREALGRASGRAAGRAAGPADLVAPADACPECGERHPDRLEWMNDEDDQVRCTTCGFVYSAPGHPAKGTD